MAKFRCPQCGASHAEKPYKCRLCGFIMDGTVAMPSAGSGARQTVEAKKGLGSTALVGIVLVLVIGLAAIGLGVSSGGFSSGKIRTFAGKYIPALKDHNDGWETKADAANGYQVELPSNNQPNTAPFPPVENARLSGLSATVSKETTIGVLTGKVTPVAGETPKVTVGRLADAGLALTNGFASQPPTVIKRTETAFQGYPAVLYDLGRVGLSGDAADPGFEKSLVFLKGDTMYVLYSQTVYKDHPQWDRLQSSFHFTA